MTQNHYQAAIAAFDQANNEDPNKEMADGKEYPRELLYSRRMSEMRERYAPDATEAVKLAVHAQHIQRWKTPRSNYPMTSKAICNGAPACTNSMPRLPDGS